MVDGDAVQHACRCIRSSAARSTGGGFARRSRLSRRGSATPARSTPTPPGRSGTTRRPMPRCSCRHFAHGRISVEMRAQLARCAGRGVLRRRQRFAPRATAPASPTAPRRSASPTRVQAARFFAVGGGLDSIQTETGPAERGASIAAADPTYRRSRVFAEIDSRTSPATRDSGGLYRLEWSDYRQTNAGPYSFRRVDAEVQQFVPLLRENWVIALRALASTTEHGRRPGRAVLPDARSRRQPHAARLSRLALPRSQPAAPDGRISLDRRAVRRHGALPRRRQGREPRERPRTCSGFKTTYGIGMSFHTPTSTVTRIEVARTHEGTQPGCSRSARASKHVAKLRRTRPDPSGPALRGLATT